MQTSLRANQPVLACNPFDLRLVLRPVEPEGAERLPQPGLVRGVLDPRRPRHPGRGQFDPDGIRPAGVLPAVAHYDRAKLAAPPVGRLAQ